MFGFGPRVGDFPLQSERVFGGRLGLIDLTGQGLGVGGQRAGAAPLRHRRAPGGLDGNGGVFAFRLGPLRVRGLAPLPGFLYLLGGHRLPTGQGRFRVRRRATHPARAALGQPGSQFRRDAGQPGVQQLLMFVHQPVMGLDRGQSRRVEFGQPGLQAGKPGRGAHAPVYGFQMLRRRAQPGRGGTRLGEPRFQRGDAIWKILPGPFQGGDAFLGAGRVLFQPVQLVLPTGQALFVVRVVLQPGGGGLGGLGPGGRVGATPPGERVLAGL